MNNDRSDWALIGRGFVIAVTGAASVMLYILGLSNLYIGFPGAGAGYLVGAAILLIVFLRLLDPYLSALGETGDAPIHGDGDRP